MDQLGLSLWNFLAQIFVFLVVVSSWRSGRFLPSQNSWTSAPT